MLHRSQHNLKFAHYTKRSFSKTNPKYYISSITIRANSANNALVPNATTGQVTIPGTDANAAATKLCVDYSRFKIVTGA